MTVSPQSPAPAAPPERTPLRVRFLAYRLLWLIALGVFVSDQASKAWIVKTLPLGAYGPPEAIPVIRGFFNIVHVGNPGAAWSLFSDYGFLLGLLALGTLVAIFFWRQTLGLRNRVPQFAFGFLCGGIAGNLTDRVLYGHVVDFLDFHFGSYIYPTFNVADSAICAGVILYLWHSLRNPD